ncbi:ferredoxin [Caulobacter segnis]|uniref:FixH family protein n=2 Tax=Caulobacter segnis TaxID=88688 RepID=D5VJF2_CAUST|nr:FixH family protein [Caulobacter segnis]ADG10361.1 FixH family protein [Caulobacter segnis ATCC 21756]AVQ02093.1 ferredoxin [Caulobacter segnis]
MTSATQTIAKVPSEKGRITGWHVLIGVVLFFATVIAVDIVFMVQAYRTFSGEVASNPYETGLAFNRTLAQRQKEAALGWSASVETPEGKAVVVKVLDRDAKPLDGLSLTGVLERPATETGRQTLNFRSLGGGRYQAAARLDGAWDLRATARNAKDMFEIETRLVEPAR